jgi:hypothetical protein
MAWHITGTDLGPCSCDVGCPEEFPLMQDGACYQ